MKINTDINILGGLPDWKLVEYFYNNKAIKKELNINSITSIKTNKSVNRFMNAIHNTLLYFQTPNVEVLFRTLIEKEGISKPTLFFLFWNASVNNDLFRYLNENVYFPAFFSGRYSINYDEVVACLMDLKKEEQELEKWSGGTIKKTASKYLTLLKKFGLLEGTQTKKILHPFLDDKLLILFIFWLISISDKSNLLKSLWLKYSFTEPQTFIERITKKQFTKYIDIIYTGDNLKIEPLIEYGELYENITGN